MSSLPPSLRPLKRRVRRPYDPLRHCGAPMDRSPERLIRRVETYTVKVAELEALKAERPLTGFEGKRLQRSQNFIVWAQAGLERLRQFGPDDRPCMRAKGAHTSHPGVKFCAWHCECKGRETFHIGAKHKYGDKHRAPKLREIMDRMEAAGHDLLDLEPELLLVKAKLELFVNEKDDFDPETVRSFGIIVEQIRKMVETLNDKKFKSMISMDMYNVILYRMSEVLMKHVTDPEVLDRIVEGWSKITVETAGKRSAQIIGELSSG